MTKKRVVVGAIAATLLGWTNLQAQSIHLASGGSDQVWVGPDAGTRAGMWLDQGAVSSGDGRRDLIIGAPGSADVPGRVYVLFGGPVRSGQLSLSNADAVISALAPGDAFGTSTAAGNIWNTDGASPRALVVGAPNAGAGNAGRVYLFRGGFSNGAALTTSNALLEIRGRSGDQIGQSLATADLNADGYREIIIGAPGTGRVYVINGGPSLNHNGAPVVLDLNTTAPAITFQGVAIGATLTAGDLTGDNVYDLVIGAPNANTVHLVRGRPGGFPATWNFTLTPADVTFVGTTTGDRAGASVRIAELIGSRRDLIIGAPGGDGPNESRVDAGEVYAVLGSTLQSLNAAAPSVLNLASADVRFYGAQAGHAAGTSVTAGDINRDTPNDLVIYAPGASAAGEWMAYYGRSRTTIGSANPDGNRVVDLATDVDRRIIGDPARGQITSAQVFEVTGEGARDIIVGAPTGDSAAGVVYFTISPKMRLSDSNVSVSVVVNAGQSFAYRIQVRNTSEVPITWGTSTNRSWLTTNPEAGAAVAGNDGVFYIVASAPNMTPGTYTGTVNVFSTSRDLEMTLSISVTMQVAPASREPGDFSGDGAFDIVWQHETQGWLSLWRMQGTTLVGGVSLSPDRVPDTNWKIVGTGDFNGDGHPDLLWHHRTQGWISAWLMNGTSQVTGVSISPERVADTDWNIVATGDFNADGRRDIVWQHRTQNLLSVWLMNGTTLIDGRVLTPDRVPAGWRIVGAGDFNQDGRTDLVWQNQSNGALAVWFMNGTTMMSGVSMSPGAVADTNWKIRAVGDVNGDGRPDLLWQHIGNGSLSAWFMNGTTMMSGTLLSPSSVPDLAWRIAGPK